jgi:hypothetical protein
VTQLLGVASSPPPSSTDRSGVFAPPKPRTLPPPPAPEPPATIEERYAKLQARLAQMSDDFKATYEENFVMSWIHHDSALEGVVYTSVATSRPSRWCASSASASASQPRWTS